MDIYILVESKLHKKYKLILIQSVLSFIYSLGQIQLLFHVGNYAMGWATFRVNRY